MQAAELLHFPMPPHQRQNDEKRVDRLARLQQKYMRDLNELLVQTIAAGTEAAMAPLADRRFASPEWQKDPYFALLAKTFLLGESFLHDLVAAQKAPTRAEQQLQMLIRQLTSALCPANFLQTNPEALNLARRTNGQSLLAGLDNLARDLAKGRISHTDPGAFELGKTLATTPGAVVFENELMQLIQYEPSTAIVDERPLLIVPPCINRFYVLDLQPESSLVRYALAQGRTVFMLSWRSADRATQHCTWDDYLQKGVLQAAAAARAICHADRVHALGFCIGGTLLACASAVDAARGGDTFASLTLLTTLLDFAQPGELGAFIDAAAVASREATIGRGGLLFGDELAAVFAGLRANDLVWPYVISNYLKGRRPPAFDILFWNSDPTNLPGPMVCWYLRHAYLENRIRTPGATTQCGVPVDFSRLSVPIYLLAARDDHIVPWQSAFRSCRLLGGPARFVLAASGHIAGVLNPPPRQARNYWTDGTQGLGPRTWLRTATESPGSWWPDWAAWLSAQRTQNRPARRPLGSAGYPAIEPAPGRYVWTPAVRPAAG